MSMNPMGDFRRYRSIVLPNARRIGRVSARCFGGEQDHAGFTVVELLTLMAIVGILAVIVLGAASSARERARIAQARSELGALAQALEAYKLQFGDFPETAAFAARGPGGNGASQIAVGDAEAKLFNALCGKLGPKMDSVDGKPFLEITHFHCETTAVPDAAAPAPNEVANAFVDPWGRRYQYFYRNATAPAGWTRPVYVLYSAGPDGDHVPPDPTGNTAVNDPGDLNVDNLYASK